jgi:hypothetical protein
MVTKAHFINPVLFGWGQAYGIAPEGSADFKHLPLKMDFALLLHFSDGQARVILNRGQGLGIRRRLGSYRLAGTVNSNASCGRS